jgi:hypothetical protein
MLLCADPATPSLLLQPTEQGQQWQAAMMGSGFCSAEGAWHRLCPIELGDAMMVVYGVSVCAQGALASLHAPVGGMEEA